MAKQLLVVADDYGVHKVINDGIEKCIEAGVVDCVDVVVTLRTSGRFIRQLAERIKTDEKFKNLKLGLHLVLTVGAPAYREDDAYLDLIAEKHQGYQRFKYKSAAEISSRVPLFKNHLPAFKREIEEQVKRFCEYTGLEKPQHISSHEGVFQASKEIYQVFSNYAASNSIPFRCPTLLSFDPEKRDLWSVPDQNFLPWYGFAMTNAALILPWVKRKIKPVFEKQRKQDHLFSTDYFIEHFFCNATLDNLLQILNNLEEHSYEMVIHPVFYTKNEWRDIPRGIKANKNSMEDRLAEMHLLTYVNWKKLLEQFGVERFALERGLIS